MAALPGDWSGAAGTGRSAAAGFSAAAVVSLALVAGLWLRLDRLDLRPMHNDEANQAINADNKVKDPKRGRDYVGFIGNGSNAHGPSPFKLHIHLDLVPTKASKPAKP